MIDQMLGEYQIFCDLRQVRLAYERTGATPEQWRKLADNFAAVDAQANASTCRRRAAQAEMSHAVPALP